MVISLDTGQRTGSKNQDNIVGIDMSTTFDTIDRNKLIQIFENFLDKMKSR